LAKRTEEEIQKICDDYANNKLSLTKIAKKYKIDRKTVKKILLSQSITERTHSQSNRIYDVDEHVFDKIDSPKIMWLLGWIVSDGCLYYCLKSNSYSLSWGLHQKDKSVLYHISNIFYKDKKDHVYLYNHQNKFRAELKINGHILGKRLKEIGIHPRKSLTSEYPKIIKDLPIDQQYAFIGGFYEGDGGLYFAIRKRKTKQNSLCANCSLIGTKDICDNIANILKTNLNIHGSISKAGRDGTNVWRLIINGNKQVRKFLDWIYQDVNSGAADYFLPRKYERYLDLCKYMDKGIMPEKLTYNAFKAPHSDDNIIEAAE